DRRVPVAREDPVLALERVDGAHLHRLVVPEERVRADAALPVVDERALVVRPQQDELPVELAEVVLGETLDLAVRHARAVADHPAQAALGWEHLSHAGRLYLSDEERNRVAL